MIDVVAFISSIIYYFSQCQEAHKAWTSFLHLGRFEAAWRAVFQEFQPALFLSTSTIRLQVVFGRPLFLLPSGVHPKATAQSFVGSFRSTWLIQFHLFLLTSSLIFPAPASSRTVAFDTCCCHRILNVHYRNYGHYFEYPTSKSADKSWNVNQSPNHHI